MNKLPNGFIVTDSNVAKIYGCLLGSNFIVLEAGEQSKSGENYLRVAEAVNKDTIIALGGGMVGDLAGFVASTCKRGISLIHIPTTLLAMVDSSVGGKNGINLGLKKNYLGTIYGASEIIRDLSFLNTLPDKEFRNGIAEIIKYGFTIDDKLKKRVLKGIKKTDRDLNGIIEECVKIKNEIVKLDPKDKGIRHVLNFGHTIGHALELLLNLSHGEAISIGMIKEWELVGKDIKELKTALEINGLPTNIDISQHVDKIIEIMSEDKKGKFVFAVDKDNYNLNIEKDIVLKFIK